MRFIKKSSFGFTFIELILVTAILAVVSLAIYTTFNNGIKIWQRINKQLPEEDVDIFFDKFARDLRNTSKFRGINFIGKEDRIEFASLINSRQLKKRTVGQVIYFYDTSVGILKREQRDFSQVFTGQEGLVTWALINFKSLKLQYYVYDREKKEYLWQEECLTGTMPLAVRIDLELKDGTQIHKFTKTVSIPISG